MRKELRGIQVRESCRLWAEKLPRSLRRRETPRGREGRSQESEAQAEKMRQDWLGAGAAGGRSGDREVCQLRLHGSRGGRETARPSPGLSPHNYTTSAASPAWAGALRLRSVPPPSGTVQSSSLRDFHPSS